MAQNEKKNSFSDDVPLLISVLLREFMAVALLLVLESRVDSYDFFNKPLVLFLVLITVRLPYINSYVYLFEASGIHKWKAHTRHGSRSDANNTYYFHAVFFLFVVAAHVLGAVAAAAARVYFDVQYGYEVQSASGRELKLGLTTNVNALAGYESMWLGEDRRTCFADRNLNGTQTIWFPLKGADDYCLTATNLQIWYIGEEAAYVFLLCVCFVHLWLGTGVKEPKASVRTDPFSRDYWAKLFRLSIVLTAANAALQRAFPTAHGSFHTTIYYHYRQMWTPDSNYIDTQHSELFFRVLGGLVGAGLGLLYNSSLASTQDADGDPGFFKLVWGFPRDSESRAEGEGGGSSAFSFHGEQSAKVVWGQASQLPTPKAGGDFKLRIPYSLS